MSIAGGSRQPAARRLRLDRRRRHLIWRQPPRAERVDAQRQQLQQRAAVSTAQRDGAASVAASDAAVHDGVDERTCRRRRGRLVRPLHGDHLSSEQRAQRLKLHERLVGGGERRASDAHGVRGGPVRRRRHLQEGERGGQVVGSAAEQRCERGRRRYSREAAHSKVEQMLMWQPRRRLGRNKYALPALVHQVERLLIGALVG
mmetsp:Transcript_14061/g.32036  ORF Transcript_14061/g.32036 Transcript_14061/m.32036 type:complete len:202 (-) Transcript_14061:717-1322(-)